MSVCNYSFVFSSTITFVIPPNTGSSQWGEANWRDRRRVIQF
jgi:hypothetical protein